MSGPWIQLPFYLLLIVAGLWLSVSWACAKALYSTENAGLKRLDSAESQLALAHILSHDFANQAWLDDNRFVPLGAFRTPFIDLAVWQRSGERTYFSIYLTKSLRRIVDIETMLDGGGGLTTGNSSDAHVLPPRPGHWKQCLPVDDMAELFRQHELGVVFLTQMTGARPSREQIDVVEEIIASTKAQCAYVRSLPLWFLRAPYWYFVRRNLMFGKSVRDQYEAQVQRAPAVGPMFGDRNP